MGCIGVEAGVDDDGNEWVFKVVSLKELANGSTSKSSVLSLSIAFVAFMSVDVGSSGLGFNPEQPEPHRPLRRVR